MKNIKNKRIFHMSLCSILTTTSILFCFSISAFAGDDKIKLIDIKPGSTIKFGKAFTLPELPAGIVVNSFQNGKPSSAISDICNIEPQPGVKGPIVVSPDLVVTEVRNLSKVLAYIKIDNPQVKSIYCYPGADRKYDPREATLGDLSKHLNIPVSLVSVDISTLGSDVNKQLHSSGPECDGPIGNSKVKEKQKKDEDSK